MTGRPRLSAHTPECRLIGRSPILSVRAPMPDVTLQFLGSGDAFGSGGRFQACISIRARGAHLLLDFGASSLIAMKRREVDASSVDAVIVSHLHGDHFGGIPFLVLDQQFAGRERPLVLAGPPGMRQRVLEAMEVLFPGSSRVERRFELRFQELSERFETVVGSAMVTGYEVPHASGAPAYALRLDCTGKVIAYSGDTEWTDVLLDVARGADLFVCEAYFYDKQVKNHLSYSMLRQQLRRLASRRVVLTHLSADMLRRRSEIPEEIAYDGLSLIL
jgi:ribonuclease BN (tRNA processing enzyme)